MTIALERPNKALAPIALNETVARIRVLEGTKPDTMRLGLSRLATAHLDIELIQQHLSSEGSNIVAVTSSDASEAPFIERSLEIQPPLDARQLKAFGGLLVEDVFADPRSTETPEATLLIDSRGSYAPVHAYDNGISVTGDRSSILV